MSLMLPYITSIYQKRLRRRVVFYFLLYSLPFAFATGSTIWSGQMNFKHGLTTQKQYFTNKRMNLGANSLSWLVSESEERNKIFKNCHFNRLKERRDLNRENTRVNNIKDLFYNWISWEIIFGLFFTANKYSEENINKKR